MRVMKKTKKSEEDKIEESRNKVKKELEENQKDCDRGGLGGKGRGGEETGEKERKTKETQDEGTRGGDTVRTRFKETDLT